VTKPLNGSIAIYTFIAVIIIDDERAE